jgi:colanic acid/amylovoran biosynthesis glycosyltransferase
MTVPPKVGYVLEPPYPTFFVEEVEAVRKAGAEVTVFNSFRPFPQSYEAAERMRAESHYFPPGYRGLLRATARSALARPLGYARALAFVARHRLGRLVLLAASYAEVVRGKAIEHLHAGYGTTPATVAMLTSWLSGRPYSFTLHAYDLFQENPTLTFKANHARFVSTISQFNKEFIARTFPAIDLRRVQVVRLGVDLETWSMRPPASRSGPTQCLCVANLVPFKGHEVLLRAVAALHQRGTAVRCALVGDGPLRPDLEALAATLGIGAVVEFTGRLDPAAVRARLAAADVFILPGVVDQGGNRDGIPVALMEAMATGVPVVSSVVSGIPELVKDGETGWLCPPGDAPALADAIHDVARDAARAQARAQAARRWVEAEFDLRRTAREMIRLFTGVPA